MRRFHRVEILRDHPANAGGGQRTGRHRSRLRHAVCLPIELAKSRSPRLAGGSAALKRAGLDEAEWTPREMRHSFVSVLSANGVAVEHISRLVGHKGTAVTEKVYRLQIQPVMEEGAMAMDHILPEKPPVAAD